MPCRLTLEVLEDRALLSFSPSAYFATAPQPYDVNTADVNGDGATDVAVTNSLSNNVAVLFNVTAGKARPGFGPSVVGIAPGVSISPASAGLDNPAAGATLASAVAPWDAPNADFFFADGGGDSAWDQRRTWPTLWGHWNLSPTRGRKRDVHSFEEKDISFVFTFSVQPL
jgi:hypothetical protein